MRKNVIKRNGEERLFDETKIENAIRKAAKEKTGGTPIPEKKIQKMVKDIASACEKLNRAIPVEEIQDMVETKLMQEGEFDVAKKYITYRYKRSLLRKSNTTDARIISLVDCNNEDVKQENSNKNPTVAATQRDYIAGEVSKDICSRMILPKDIVQAHKEGLIHFHDMDYFLQRIFNCFSGGTKFITDSGIREFRNFNDGDKVVVLAKDGELREATVRCYGEKTMQHVVLKNNRTEVAVTCTPDHRWILKDGTVTTDLKEGDRLFCMVDSSKKEPQTTDEYKAWCLGFAIGDGSDGGIKDGINWLHVRLCGNKSRHSEKFIKAGWSVTEPPSMEGDKYAEIGRISKQKFLDGEGWKFLPANMQGMLMRGLFAADGCYDRNAIFTSDDRVASMIRDIAGMGGYAILSEKEIIHDTEFKKDARLIQFGLSSHQADNWNWRVVSIEKNYRTCQSYCVEEPVTHSFTLDKGVVTGNCCLINIEDMLQNGTVVNGNKIEKPKSFLTACTIATQISAAVASNQYGGQTITLTHLAPFIDISRQKIRKTMEEDGIAEKFSKTELDKMVEKAVRREVRAGVQTIQYQVSTIATSNGQAPFITLFMYLNEAKDEQTKKDLAILIEEVLRQRILGVKNEVGVYVAPAFPKLIYVLEEDNVKEGTPYWGLTKLAAECTAKRMVPDYISEKKMLEYKKDADGDGYCYPCMGCRSFLTVPRGDVEKGKFYGRFNQGVVTINLVDVALSADKDVDKFWSILEERCELCHKALRCRHERLLGTLSDTSPIHWQHGAIARLKKGETIDKLLYGGYSTISLGYAGLWECVYAIIGKKLTEPEGEKFGLKVMQKLNDFTAKWKKAENIDYSLYGTPLESTTYKFAKCLQKRFGVIKGVTDREYITNSYHVHVTEPITAFDKLAFEAKFQRLSPGGAISYVEVPNMQGNIAAVLSIMQFMYDNIQYSELNTKIDYCQCCGFDGEIQIVKDENGKLVWECPKCGNRDQSKMNVVRRTCGYLGSQYWNQGRTEEIQDRVLHVS